MTPIETQLAAIEARNSALAQCDWRFQVDCRSPNGRDECSIWRGDKRIVGGIRGPEKAAKICRELEREKSEQLDIPALAKALRRALDWIDEAIREGHGKEQAQFAKADIAAILAQK